MLDISKRDRSDPDVRKVIVLELVAASSIFRIVALVRCVVFTYQPS